MELTKKTSKHVLYWYEQMVNCFGPKSRSISLECFVKDFFIFCIDMGACPNHMLPDDESQPLQLVMSGTVDFSLKFNTILQKNLVLHVIAKQSAIISVGPSGSIDDIAE